jgi:hypothetical protein
MLASASFNVFCLSLAKHEKVRKIRKVSTATTGHGGKELVC